MEAIRAVLQGIFGDAQIGDVYVAIACEDEILLLRVVFDDTEDQFDARKATSRGCHMHPRLAKIGEQAFPIISYVSSEEMRRLKDAVGRSSERG